MSVPFIDVAGLKQHLAHEKENVDAWAHSRTESAQKVSEEHFQEAQAQTGESHATGDGFCGANTAELRTEGITLCASQRR